MKNVHKTDRNDQNRRFFVLERRFSVLLQRLCVLNVPGDIMEYEK